MNATRNIPCHVIAGPLGVGKTSAILHYLREHASTQRVGVLVNDFGPVGLDSTTLAAEASSTTVLNVPGGCICCTMLAELPDRIRKLTADPEIDRIIIEPSGMAAPAQVLDLLRGNESALGISLRPAIVMLSMTDFDEQTFERRGYFQMFCEAADVLVFNRCDQVNEVKIERARRWAEQLDPPKLRVVTTSHGELPPDVFDLEAEEAGCGCDHHGHDHEHHHHHDAHDHDHGHDDHHHHHHDHDPTIHPGGAVLDSERVFDEKALIANVERVCDDGVAENRVLRLKGAFQTDAGWRSVEIASGNVSCRPSSHRGDTRLEWLTQPGPVDETRMLNEITRLPEAREIDQCRR